MATDACIDQYGLGAASEFMIKATGCCVGAQGIVYTILIFTSPVGAWAVFAYEKIHAALLLIFGWMTVNGKWAEVEDVKVTAEGYIVPAILLVFHLRIMFHMRDIIYGAAVIAS